MIAALVFEFGLLYSLYRFLCVHGSRAIYRSWTDLYAVLANLWVVQTTLTATYLAWKYLP